MDESTTVLVTPNGLRKTIDEISKEARTIHGTPVPIAANLTDLKDNSDDYEYTIAIKYSVLDVDCRKYTKIMSMYHMNNSLSQEELSSESPKFQVRKILAHAPVPEKTLASIYSNDMEYLAVVKERSVPGHKDDQQLIELWKRGILIKSLDLTNNLNHGKVITHPDVSFMSWIPVGKKQDKFMFVCEPKKDLGGFYYSDSRTDSTTRERLGHRYEWTSDFGETFEGIEKMIVAVVDTSSPDFKTYLISNKEYSLAQPQFFRKGEAIVAIGYPDQVKLGLKHCNNRHCGIFAYDWETGNELFRILQDHFSIHTPRVNHAGDEIFYLKNELYGPHRRSSCICLYNDNRQEHITLQGPDGDMRYYVTSVPQQAFSEKDDFVIFSHEQNTFDEVIRYVSFRHQHTAVIDNGDDRTSSIFEFKRNVLITTSSRITKTPSVEVHKLEFDSVKKEMKGCKQVLDFGLNYEGEIEYERFEMRTGDDLAMMSGILVTPARGKELPRKSIPPTVVTAHGGPNSCFLDRFAWSFLFDARMGYQTLAINYRGSTGRDEDNASSLLGRIGDLDIKDCIDFIKHMVAKGKIDPSRLIYTGGSHGGFIGAYLATCEDFTFNAVILRNPVMNLFSMMVESDIPDWIYAQALGRASENLADISVAELTRLHDASPFFRASKVKSKILMLLGSQDRRVPMQAALRYVDALKILKKEHLCKVYEAGHALDKAESFVDVWMTMIIWKLSTIDENKEAIRMANLKLDQMSIKSKSA